MSISTLRELLLPPPPPAVSAALIISDEMPRCLAVRLPQGRLDTARARSTMIQVGYLVRWIRLRQVPTAVRRLPTVAPRVAIAAALPLVVRIRIITKGRGTPDFSTSSTAIKMAILTIRATSNLIQARRAPLALAKTRMTVAITNVIDCTKTLRRNFWNKRVFRPGRSK